MRYLFLPILFVLMLPFTGQSQVCIVNVSPQDTTICPGDSVGIVGYAAIVATGQNFDFDLGALPAGWAATGGSAWGNPCGAGINGTPYYWASTSGGGVPTVGSPGFDVTCGGFLNFDMVFSQQGGASPCEGPDLADEGVSLQYSTDGGLTWIDIIYYSPGGFTLPAMPGTSGSVASGPTIYTTWNSFSVPIPVGAFTTNTMFQWTQINSSGTCCDNWGLDNIEIFGGPCNTALISWDGGSTNTNAFWVTPTQDTSFVADVYDTLGNYMCSSDTIFITVLQPTLTWDLVDTLYAYCPTDSLPAEVVNFANAIAPWDVLWSNGDTINPTLFGTNGNQQDLITYTVEITDGCGYVYEDTVMMLVNQTLAIDTVLSFPASACDFDGAASAVISGITNALGQPLYNWSGPGTSGTFSIDGTSTPQILSPGWYYFTVSDDVCEASDSVYVDVENPPIAEFSPLSLQGCSPLVVDFTNTSQNTNTYTWIWGDFSANSNDVNPSHTFTTSSNVMLIAFASANCSDTAYASIIVEPCGCTDPLALNYNPNATIDDGFCIFPEPTVIAPNVFTPNGDDINDVYSLEVTNAINVHLVILNRWGNVVFDQQGLNPVWNGTAPSGNKVQEGTYFYKYIVTGVDETVDPLEGHGFIQVVNN
jgi:gliding motility-associated-like protein